MEIEVHSGDYLAQLQRDYPDATLSDIVFPGELLWYIDSGGDNDEFFRSAWYCGYAGYDLDWDGAGCTTSISISHARCSMLDSRYGSRNIRTSRTYLTIVLNMIYYPYIA